MNNRPSMSEIMAAVRGEGLRKIANLLGVGKGLTRRGDLEAALLQTARAQLAKVIGHCTEAEKKIERPLNVYAGESGVFLELRRMLILAQSGKIRLTPKGGAPADKSVPILASALVCPDFSLEAPEDDKKNDQWYVPGGPVRAYAWGVLAQHSGGVNRLTEGWRSLRPAKIR